MKATGPSNTRRYTVAVYFRGERLASGCNYSIQGAEMEAAAAALSKHRGIYMYGFKLGACHGDSVGFLNDW